MKQFSNWNEESLQELKRKGKIRDYTQKQHKNIPYKVSKEKAWLSDNLLYWANNKCLHIETEYKFHAEKKWRSDWAIPALKILIEFEGIICAKSRHTTITGYSNDATKYREASKLGYIILRYTALNYKEVLNDLNQILSNLNQILLNKIYEQTNNR